MITVLEGEEKICKNCYLYSTHQKLCLLTGDFKKKRDTCEKWLEDKYSEGKEETNAIPESLF